jgi:hypothetical protein
VSPDHGHRSSTKAVSTARSASPEK